MTNNHDHEPEDWGHEDCEECALARIKANPYVRDLEARLAELTDAAVKAKEYIERTEDPEVVASLRADLAAALAREAALRGSLIHTLANLCATVSLLERGGKKAAASDKMFAQMLKDYNNAIKSGRAVLAANPAPPESTGTSEAVEPFSPQPGPSEAGATVSLSPARYWYECRSCGCRYLQYSDTPDRCSSCGSTKVEPLDTGGAK